MCTDLDYEAIAERRTKALIESFRQTYNEVKDRMRVKYPDEPKWFLDLVCRIAWVNAWR